MPTQQEITKSLALITETFKAFRAELMDAYGVIEHVSKGDNSPVTELDVKIETELKEKLLAEFPDFGFKGEETDEVPSKSGATWLVDPIDSTGSFIRGLPYCSNMAALVFDGEVIASVIYHFTDDELFTAQKGHGAYKNGKRLHVRDTVLSDACVFADAGAYIHAYKFYAPHKVRFYAPVGATGYFFTRLAQSSIQGVAYLTARIKPHDVAPGLLIAQEAGAHAVSLDNTPLSYTSTRLFAGTETLCSLTSSHRQEMIAAFKDIA